MVNGMTRWFVTVIGVLHYFCAAAQVDETYIHRHPFTLSSHASYLNGHIYFNQGYFRDWDIDSYEQWLMKYDLHLNPTDSLNLGNLIKPDSGAVFRCTFMESWSGNILLVLSEGIPDSTNAFGIRHESHILLIDSLLGLVKHIAVEDSSSGIQLFDIIELGNNWYATGFMSNDSNYLGCMVKIDPVQNTYQANTYYTKSSDEYEAYAQAIAIDNSILVSIEPGIPPLSIELLAVFDTSMNMLKRETMMDPLGEPVYMPNPGVFVKPSQKPPIFLSSAIGEHDLSWNFPYMLMGAAKLDSTLSLTDIDTFRFSGNNSSTPNGAINPEPVSDALGYLTPDSALLAMAGQEMLFGYGFIDRYANDVYLYNYNGSSEDLNWLQVYNNGYTQSSFTPVEALPNNQYLVILNEYNWDKYPYDNLSIHLMILNSNGVLINTEERLHHREALRVFPNPCRDRVWVENLEPVPDGSYTYELLDVSGARLEKGYILPGGAIKFSERFTGMHLLRIFRKGDLVQSLLLKGR